MVKKKIKTTAKPVPAEATLLASEIPAEPSVPRDDVTPRDAGFPIVGIGASAGGLAAFEAFLSGMPTDADPGMAFVLVQHLAPEHRSLLAELIRRKTRMQVFEVEDGMVVQPNCAYIIPPGRDMAFRNGALRLTEPSAPRGQRFPIDFFFQSLAQDQHERAIGIVLSGTGSDGTLGVRAIKAAGGMVMAQSPASTEFDGMPRSALGTGLVDDELPPAEMAAGLIRYAAHAFGSLPRVGAVSARRTENALQKIFVLLRAQTSHDFSLYKPSTIQRRIERRMAVHQFASIDDYEKFLRQSPAEVEALFRDLLIGVTSFFRDPDVFQLLEHAVVPGLFDNKPTDALVRVWVAGCSTGEEAYSLAILLVERMEALRKRYTVQVFATDIDSAAIATARAGLYPASIAADVNPERLARFFMAEPDGSGYRVHKGIRDLIIFSKQDVIKDPPFSKLDLVSCRNVLIYMSAKLQKKLIPTFHFALRPGGTLLLGMSEGIGEYDTLFTAVDRKARVYRRTDDSRGTQSRMRAGFLPNMTAVDAAGRRGRDRTEFPVKRPLRELTEQALLQQVVAAGALVNAEGDILYLHGRTGLFLELAPGEAGVNNIVKMAREGLGYELAAALRQAVRTQETAHHSGLRLKTSGRFTTVNLTVRLVTRGQGASQEAPLYLVILEEVLSATTDGVEPNAPLHGQASVGGDAALAPILSTPEAEARLASQARELRAQEEYLQSAREDLQSSTEELKSSNEEMQSVNEELQSTNEELETTKEEMQSVNEELASVNAELQAKLSDLSRANDDMNNLLGGTGIGTVFLDHQLRILRFTPAVRSIINLIPSDVGRPVAHIVTNFVDYGGLVPAVLAVLDTLVPTELELQTTDGRWYLMRMLPYRTQHNVVEGAVISFLDVTETVRIRESLRKANDLLRLAVVVRDAHDAITVQDINGRIIAWNPGAVRLYGWSEAEALVMHANERIPPELRAGALTRLTQLSRAEILEPYLTQRLTKSGAKVNVTIISTALMNEAGQLYAIATTERAKPGDSS